MAVLWLFVRGVELTPQYLLKEFIISLGVGMGITFFFRRFYGDGAPIARSLRVAPCAALYPTTFLWELLTANVGVAVRTLSSSVPIGPAVVEMPLHVRTPLTVTAIASSITLTPGTLTMDYDDETNSLYVHSIDGNGPDGILKPIRHWEDYAPVIFDGELRPGGPAPQVEGSSADGGDVPAAATGGEQHG